MKCFASTAALLAPCGGRLFAGNDGLEKWFQGEERTWSEFAMHLAFVFVGGDRAVVQWQAEGLSHSRKRAEFTGINVFTVVVDELICRPEGY